MRFKKKNILVNALHHYFIVGVQLVSGIYIYNIPNVFFNIFIKKYLTNKMSYNLKKNEV